MKSLLFGLLLCSFCVDAQLAYNLTPLLTDASITGGHLAAPPLFSRKLYQRNTGMILGLQKGKYTNLELGGEAHWRKISLLKPYIYGATANLEYNFEENVIGYKAGMWMKHGRINLTYGVNVNYYTNFDGGHRFGFGPSVGFRLLGLHLVNGYTFFTSNAKPADEKFVAANPLYMSLRYYFPVQNKFAWDRATRKKKREKQKSRENRRKERAKEKEKGEGKSFLDLFKKKEKN
jgi:hypothetical protein